jgi:hypothetical protein
MKLTIAVEIGSGFLNWLEIAASTDLCHALFWSVSVIERFF